MTPSFTVGSIIRVKAQLLQKYSDTPFGIIELGNIGTLELKRLLKCLLKSTFISNDIKTLLLAFKNTL